jgi:hypothetical protein
MMSGVVAYMPRLPRYVPYAWVFVIVVLLLIALIFVRVYVLGDWSRRRAAHRPGRRTAHPSGRTAHRTQRTVRRASHGPGRGGGHGHQPAPKRRSRRT